MLNEYNPQVLEDLIDGSRSINDWESGIKIIMIIINDNLSLLSY